MKPGDLLRHKHTPGLTVVLLEKLNNGQEVWIGGDSVHGYVFKALYPDGVIYTAGIILERWEVVGGG
jgi:hypothetical protein